MKKLGVKLQAELPPGSLVLSNVFSIPGWRAVGTSAHGTHIYMVPPAAEDDENDNDHSHDELPLLSKDDDDVSTNVLVASTETTAIRTREEKKRSVEQDGK